MDETHASRMAVGRIVSSSPARSHSRRRAQVKRRRAVLELARVEDVPADDVAQLAACTLVATGRASVAILDGDYERRLLRRLTRMTERTA